LVQPMRHELKSVRSMNTWYLLFIFVTALPTSSAWSWGELGHRAVARVAEPLLSQTARAEVKRLLGAGDDLASASVWADEVRSARPESRPWHYITSQVRGPKVKPEAADTPNVLTAMIRFEAVLAGDSRSDSRDASKGGSKGDHKGDREKAEALKWLAHFVGDAHQPLHTGEDYDRGGNETSVRLGRRKMGWHQAWDHGFLRVLGLEEDTLVQRLQDSVHAWLAAGRGAEPATFAAMVAESHALAVLAYARNGRPIKGRGRIVQLDAEDVAWAQQVTLTQLARGGIRLAHVLNRALDPKFASHRMRQGASAREATPKPSTLIRTVPPYAWSRNSQVYHAASCTDVAKMAPGNLVRGESPPPGRRMHNACAPQEN
jgi:S1/P1 Nuclease